jgi:HAD superfamily 5'-nucleotidase-like hydrolase
MSQTASVLPAPGEAATPNLRGLALIEALQRPGEIPRPERVYANRNLNLSQIELVGFDMDYTLALYNQPKIEELSILATLQKLVTNKGYPEAIQSLHYDPALGIRGLVIDRPNGNVFKPDRYGTPGRARHGWRTLDRAQRADLYQRQRTPLSNARYAWIDSLFALPEAVLYVNLVDFFDGYAGAKPDYSQLWQDIRECIDLAHRDGSIKNLVAANLGAYIERDPALAETLHKFRSSGKRLFLLTNSAWDYTDPVMKYLLDGVLPAYPSWRNYFDVIVVSAAKPLFFTREQPFVELDAEGQPAAKPSAGPFLRGRVYSGGNVREFEDRARARGDRVLFVGDHIYGDMLRSRKSSTWRTAMILQEMEQEIVVHDRMAPSLARLDDLERQLRHLDAEIADKQLVLRSLQKLEEPGTKPPSSEGRTPDEIAAAKRTVKELLDKLRAELRASMAEHTRLEAELDAAFNPHWGPLFREGNEISKFGEQVEAYACLYTSRVSNFRFYSPNRHFRGPRDRMPHER